MNYNDDGCTMIVGFMAFLIGLFLVMALGAKQCSGAQVPALLILVVPIYRGQRKIYHVFADMYDNFFLKRTEAEKDYRGLNREEYPNARIYWEIEDIETGDVLSEDYIRGRGEFPT